MILHWAGAMRLQGRPTGWYLGLGGGGQGGGLRRTPFVGTLSLTLAVLMLTGCVPGRTRLAEGSSQPLPAASDPTLFAASTTTLSLVPTMPPTPKATATPTPEATATPTATPTSTPVPGADLIAFESYRDGNGEVYLLEPRTGRLFNLTGHPADDRAPAWRPDGGAIAFESHRDGNWEIYILNLLDGSTRRVTEHLAYDGAPAWSPDGATLVFESYRDGNLEIYTVPAAGGEPVRLTSDDAGDLEPAWSPDGGTIAFTSWRDGNKEIYLVPASGGPARNWTQHPADDEDPAWAPDGSALAFVSWRDTDPRTGNRNAEIYQAPVTGPEDGLVGRITENPWPDLDPAWDARGRLVWVVYDPGAAFETYDPFRPGDYHLVRQDAGGAQHLSEAGWDDRRPAPAPSYGVALDRLLPFLPSIPEPASPTATLPPGTLAQISEVPSILTSFANQPVLVNELVVPSLLAWQEDVLEASGHDFLNQTLGSWRTIEQVRKKALYTYDYGYLSWHKAGRALDLALEYKVDGVNQMVLTREDLGENVYWRVYLRAARQDGTQGEPFKDNPWLYWWHIVADAEPEAYEAGGKRIPIPEGYYVDVTALAKHHGWKRIASYAIEGDYHWQTDSNGTEYWHYERTDGLVWWDAMRQIYPLDTLEEYVGWEAGMRRAQSEEMLRSKGVPAP